MKAWNCKQGSTEWLQLRCGRPTASGFDNLVSPEWEIRRGDRPTTYMLKKVAERVMGYPEQLFGGGVMEQGSLLESEAIPMYEGVFGVTVDRVGFCTTDDEKVGASPDGLIGDDNGLEVKCPEPHTHVQYLIGGCIPKQYRAQVQGCMFVTGRPKWTFISYNRFFPPLVVNVLRDDTAQESIAKALESFQRDFDAAHGRIAEMMNPTNQGENNP